MYRAVRGIVSSDLSRKTFCLTSVSDHHRIVLVKQYHLVVPLFLYHFFYPRNRPWRPIELRDVKDPTVSRQSAHS
jgi:hypothetical protein